MSLSWSQKLFLKINNHVGKNSTLDFLFVFLAQWFIFVILFVILLWAGIYLPVDRFKYFIFFGVFISIAAKMINLIIGLLWIHERPIKELPSIKQLFQPYDIWKSFPSDHATVGLVIVLVAWMFGVPFWFFLLILFLVLVMGFSRIYSGIHYPRDIIGGFVMAVVYFICSYKFLYFFYPTIVSLIKAFK